MSDFKYAYEKLIAEKNLQVKDLPADAKIGIEAIKDIEKVVRMRQKSQKEITETMVNKLKYHDNAVCRAILDSLDVEDPKGDAEDFVEEFEKKDGYEKIDGLTEGEGEGEGEEEKDPEPKLEPEPEPKKDEPAGPPKKEDLEVEEEIKKLHESGKKEVSMEELKTLAPKAWQLIFNNYTKEGDNGIETDRYSLFEENAEYMFTINKL
jgi:hypothetical protein